MLNTPDMRSKQVQDHQALAQAEALLTGGDLTAARNAFTGLLDRPALHFQAHLGLGVIASRHRDWPTAIHHLTQSTALVPDDPAAWYNLGIAHKTHGNWADAESCLHRALELDPSHANACNGLGNILAARRQPDQAQRYYRQALALQPDHVQAHFNLGVLQQNWGHAAAAAETYQQIIARHPGFAPAWSNLGIILQQQGQEQDAALMLRQALILSPAFADAQVNLGLVLLRQGHTVQAETCAQAARQLPDDADFPHYTLGVLLAQLGHAAAARHHLSQSLCRDPDDAQGAGLVLAGLGLAAIPDRLTDAQVQKLYDERAARWDHGTTGATPYQGHHLVGKLFARLYPSAQSANLRLLDAGCGTGLVAAALAPPRPVLEGVDLSAAMLEAAGGKGLYHSLHQADLVQFMASHPGRYDAILSAATLIHFGDLRPVFAAAAQAVRRKGHFLFTLFPAPDDTPDGIMLSLDHGHAQGGCYCHAPGAMASWAQATGWRVVRQETATHEFDHGRPVAALVVALQKI